MNKTQKIINKICYFCIVATLIIFFLMISGCVNVYRIDNHGGCVINGTDRDDQDFSNACSLMMDSSNNDNQDEKGGLTLEPGISMDSESLRQPMIEPIPYQGGSGSDGFQ